MPKNRKDSLTAANGKDTQQIQQKFVELILFEALVDCRNEPGSTLLIIPVTETTVMSGHHGRNKCRIPREISVNTSFLVNEPSKLIPEVSCKISRHAAMPAIIFSYFIAINQKKSMKLK